MRMTKAAGCEWVNDNVLCLHTYLELKVFSLVKKFKKKTSIIGLIHNNIRTKNFINEIMV